MDIYPPSVQRSELLLLLTALSCVPYTLRRDECGDWRIKGENGHIYAGPEGYMIIAETETGRGWRAVKNRLGFAELQRDGDSEGSFILDRLPSPAEATEIRYTMGIRKSPALSDDHRAALAERMRAMAPSIAPRLDNLLVDAEPMIAA